MWLFQTYIEQSNIHGLGLFTNVPIEQGEVVWRFDPAFDRMFTPAQVAAFPPVIRKFISLRAFLDKRTGAYFLGGDYDMFTNHDDHPNIVEDPNYRGAFTADLIAARNIAAREELTNNYAEFSDAADVLKKFSDEVW